MSSVGMPRLLRLSAAALAVSAMTACSASNPPAAQPAPPGNARMTASGDVLTREQIDRINAQSMTDLLDGRLPGVQVVALGGRPTLVIRGLRDPLVVIDNVPLTDPQELWSLNPHDVERIQILKDGSAAWYGSRGGRGVVLVTTRID